MTMWTGLGVGLPVWAAPMAGGPGTPALVEAAAVAGGLGFLAAGYRTPAELAEQIAAVRATGHPFGVNVFAPNPVPVDRDEFHRYAQELQPEADRYGLALAGDEPVEDDDHWTEKLDLLLADPVAVVSFTFGLPAPDVVAALRKAGTIVVQTVTSVDEARLAAPTGVDALAVQSSAAGGHSGTLTPRTPPPSVPLPELVAAVGAVTTLPMIAAGGVATPTAVAAAMRAGASAVMVGTVLLRSDESGASPVHRTAVAAAPAGATVVTRAFTGRPARALRNGFIDRHDAPFGYPAVHHLTSPLRRAAATAGDADLVHLWAGTGYQEATAEPAGVILSRLARSL